jgi:hypothetical protein
MNFKKKFQEASNNLSFEVAGVKSVKKGLSKKRNVNTVDPIRYRFEQIFFFKNKTINFLFLPLEQACQTGGPQAACCPIACPMRPAAILLDLKITLIS